MLTSQDDVPKTNLTLMNRAVCHAIYSYRHQPYERALSLVQVQVHTVSILYDRMTAYVAAIASIGIAMMIRLVCKCLYTVITMGPTET